MNANQAWFYRQAHSDYRLFERLAGMVGQGLVEQCHALHYLQMATEKLSKAYFLKSAPIKKSHKYFSKFWRALLTNHRVRRALEYEDRGNYSNDLKRAGVVATAVESLSPDVAGERENTEYPWPYPNYDHAPAGHHFTAWGRIQHSPDGEILMRIVGRLFERAPDCF